MHVHNRFVGGIVCGLGLAVVVFVALLYWIQGAPTESSRWAYDISRKKQALSDATPGPRLLLIGGSGTTFGLSAERIQLQTGIPTLNMGTHAGLGLEHILYWTRKVARPGDTILLIPEYELYRSTSLEPRDDFVLSYDAVFFHQMSLVDKIAMATRIPFKRIQKGFAVRRKPESPPRPHPPYTDGASFLDAYGDETGNSTATRPLHAANVDIKADVLMEGLSSDHAPGFDLLRDFARWAKEHQVHVLATFPNIVHCPDYDEPKARNVIKIINDFYAGLHIPVVGTAQEAMLPKDDFFDTYYHLTREAAVGRTDRLVPELKPYLVPEK